MYESVPDAAPILVQYLSADPTVNRIDRDIERRFILIYGGLGVLVVASIGAPLWLLIRRRRIASTVLADGTPAFAQVISLERHVYRDTDEWVIGFRYFDHAGETHASTAKVDAAEPLKWKPGDRARVAFDNAHPERSVWIG
ncbi:MAG: hypothetical protein ACRDGT_03430 [Candidatus Limnocylindria bacterium]